MADIRTKKILMTLMRLEIGGAETHVLELSLELKRKGFDVIVASGGGVYEEHLKRAGIRHYTVPMYTKSPSKVLQSLGALKKIIREEKIDIVHAHGRIPAFLCGLLHPSMKFTFVTTAHWVFRTGWGFKYLSNWGEKVMAVSEDIKTYLMDNYGTDPKDIFVTINGIDTERFSKNADFRPLLTEFSLSEDSKKIVYISRMDEDRALVAFHLAEIALDIEKECPGVEIVIVGGGNVFDKLKALTDKVNEKAGRKLITLAGARTDIDLFASMSDLFIGVSRSALEAMSCSKPVIVAGNEGYLGVFDESKLQVGIDTNFCCRGLAASTKELLLGDVKRVLSATKEEQEAWGAYSRKTICERYSVSKMAEDNAAMYCAAMAKKKWDAVISGYYGYGNSGDEALLSAMLSHMRSIEPDLNVCVLSKNPKLTQVAHGVSSVNRYHYFAIRKAMKQARLFISGGGSLLQDVTSNRSLRYYLSLIEMAQGLGTPVMLYANGIGPITKAKNRQNVGRVLSCVSVITLRENASLSELVSLGVPKEGVTVTADPALALVPAETAAVYNILQSMGVSDGEVLFGVSVRPWKDSEPSFFEKLASVIDEVAKTYGITPVFLPMKYPDDLVVSQNIIQRLTVKSYLLSQPKSAQEMIGLIGNMKFIIAERLHSLIYATNAFVPIVGLSYDAKVDAFTEHIGTCVATRVDDFSGERVLEAVSHIIESYDAIKAQLQEKKAVLCDKAKENAQIALQVIKQSEDCYEIDGN
ncbi:MAG: polysaccharide pyruvyl transferase CsaB [Clostridia bacterium]|nr:polysaccharide pyruvyl transferase CsaB [Clostridia bacterium]